MEWISVKDRLPEKQVIVATLINNNPSMGYIDDIYFNDVLIEDVWRDLLIQSLGVTIPNVTHWMPLPPKPIETTNK